MKHLISNLKKTAGFLISLAPLMVLIAIFHSLLWLLISGNSNSFLHPRFKPFLVIACIIIICFIVSWLLNNKEKSDTLPRSTLVRLMVVITPLVFLYAIVEQGMGEHAFVKKYINTDPTTFFSSGNYLDNKPSAEDEKKRDRFSILEIAMKMKRLNGKRVITRGMTYKDTNVPEDHIMLFRFTIFCCAADASPVWVLIKKDKMEPFKNESWVEVNGIMKITEIKGKDIPVIHVDEINKIETPPPSAQYLFF